jgi:D-methionine transport system substrate-binding protein
VLLVLQDKGLIKLKPGAGLKATPLDVVENPKKLKFVELDAAQLPRSLDDLDASAINTNYALSAGLNREGRDRAGSAKSLTSTCWPCASRTRTSPGSPSW